MNEQERLALSAVLEFLSEEKKHFEPCAAEEQANHVYNHAQVLESYLDGREKGR